MDTGLLYFDNDKTKTLQETIQGAVDYYVKKYDKRPNLALVHPNMLSQDGRIKAAFVMDGLTVRPYRPILPGHVWIGMEDK